MTRDPTVRLGEAISIYRSPFSLCPGPEHVRARRYETAQHVPQTRLHTDSLSHFQLQRTPQPLYLVYRYTRGERTTGYKRIAGLIVWCAAVRVGSPTRFFIWWRGGQTAHTDATSNLFHSSHTQHTPSYSSYGPPRPSGSNTPFVYIIRSRIRYTYEAYYPRRQSRPPQQEARDGTGQTTTRERERVGVSSAAAPPWSWLRKKSLKEEAPKTITAEIDSERKKLDTEDDQCGRGTEAGNAYRRNNLKMDPSTARQVRARRASRPKVKTGCNNCKNRRVKCDETRPQCTKCVRSGRQCDGYPAYRRTVEVAIPIAPRPVELAPGSQASSSGSPGSTSTSSVSPPTSKAIVIKRPSRVVNKSRPTPPPTPKIIQLSPTLYNPGGLAFDWQEGQYFQVFRTHTASELSGFFDSEFWTRSVLQESHSEASIRHAVVALGALYKTLEKASESPPGSPDDNYTGDTAPNHYNFALQQYGKALTRLRESLQNNETRSQRTILISIVLFTCFQSFTGDHRAAIFQIQSGLGLLEERRQESKQPLIRRRDDVVEDELVQMFTRLAIQAKSYDMAFHFPPPYVIQLTPKRNNENPTSPQSPSSPSAASTASMEDSNIPERFTSSQEARSALDSLCERIMRFNEALSSFYAGPNNILPSSIKSSGLGFRTQLQQWAEAFNFLLENRRTPGISNTERAGIDVLKMIQLMTTVLFLMGFSTSEKDFDNFLTPFKEIVELAKEVVVDEELSLAQARCGDLASCRHKHKPHNQIGKGTQFPGLAAHTPMGYREEDSYLHIKASFALDLGIVPPLFVVATKCRDRKLRREAIRLLLSSPRREGMWDSTLCGKVAMWIMEVEEEGMRPFEPFNPLSFSEVVNEDRRVMVKEILFDLQRREATLRCGTRGAREEDNDPRAKETYIVW